MSSNAFNCRPPLSVFRMLAASLVLLGCEQLIGADFGERDFPESSVSVPDKPTPTKTPPDEPNMPAPVSTETPDPGECPAGEMRCDGAVPQLCRQKGEGWRSLTACASAELCVLGEDKVAQCLPPPCYEGQLRCSGAALERCSADDYSWSRIDTCASEAHCSTTLGACATSACEADEMRCSGQVLEVCREASGQ